jgi:hypothetical protein
MWSSLAPAPRARSSQAGWSRAATPVIVNGHKLLAATNKAGGQIHAWKTFTLTVKATKPATTLEFQNGDSGSDNDNSLDAVSLTKR